MCIKKMYCLLLVLLVSGWIAEAQTSGLKGTDFWTTFTYYPDYPSARNVYGLYMMGERECDVVVSHAPTDTDRECFPDTIRVHLVADSAVWLKLDGDSRLLHNARWLQSANNSIHVSSSDSIWLYTYLNACVPSDSVRDHRPGELEMIAVWPTERLGCEYWLNTNTNPMGSSPYRVMAVAVEDNTLVTFEGSSSNFVNGTLMLRKGEVAHAADYDLTGVHLYSDNHKPLAVVVGIDNGHVPNNTWTSDPMAAQLVPDMYWGRKFVAALTPGRNNDRVRIVALEDNCEVRRDGGVIAQLDRGGWYEYEIDETCPVSILEGSKNISVYVYLTTSSYGNADSSGWSTPGSYSGDGSMYPLCPENQWYTQSMFFSNPYTYWERTILGLPEFEYGVHNYIGLSARTNDVENITLDGVGIGNRFVPVASDPTYSYARIKIGAGTHKVESRKGGFELHAVTLRDCSGIATCGGWAAEEIPVSDSLSLSLCQGSEALFATEEDCEWDYGDGSQGSENVHTYTDTGIYTAVGLYKRNPCQHEWDTLKAGVTVRPAYKADIYDTMDVAVASLWPQLFPDSALTHDLYHVSQYGCDSVVTLHLIVAGGTGGTQSDEPPSPGGNDVDTNKATLFLPDVFTPGLETNSLFGAVGHNICHFEIMVFHRWGEMVWQQKGLDARWDGTKDGRPCPQGSYVYLVRYSVVGRCESIRERIGTVTLLR